MTHIKLSSCSPCKGSFTKEKKPGTEKVQLFLTVEPLMSTSLSKGLLCYNIQLELLPKTDKITQVHKKVNTHALCYNDI